MKQNQKEGKMHNYLSLIVYVLAAVSLGLMIDSWKRAKRSEIIFDVVVLITYAIIWIKVSPLVVVALMYYTGRNFMTANNMI